MATSAAAGDIDAFGELVRRHQDFIYGAVIRVVRDRTLAEDLAQDTFVRAWRAIGDFRGESAVRSWLYRIATNLSLNAVQRRREYPAVQVEPQGDGGIDPARAAEARELARELVAAIRRLPDPLRDPLELREYRGLSYQQIADEMDLPLNTVRTRILRARRALRADLEEWR